MNDKQLKSVESKDESFLNQMNNNLPPRYYTKLALTWCNEVYGIVIPDQFHMEISSQKLF